jgi:hypothetical protein
MAVVSGIVFLTGLVLLFIYFFLPTLFTVLGIIALVILLVIFKD